MTLVQLERRYSSPVHILTPPGFIIPACVIAYLSKGGKFIADKRTSSASTVLHELDGFQTRLHTAAFFEGVRGDCHSGRVKSRCKVKTSWSPPIHPDIARYCRLLRQDLCKYEPSPWVKNEDFVDAAARRWLAKHVDEVCVVDADKNLGDAILPRSWVRDECLRLLREASRPVDLQAYQFATTNMKFVLDSFVHRAFSAGLITELTLKFLLQSFCSTSPGSFRLRVKLHKSPVVGRPIMNVSRTWLAPFAVYLTETLNPLLNQTKHVITSSTELLDRLVGVAVPEDMCLCTFDVRNLYPYISRNHFLLVTATRVRRFWSRSPQFAEFIMKLIELVLDSQYVTFEQQIWHISEGLPTGFQPSVVFANLYLSSFDEYLVAECNQVKIWNRFVDDAFSMLPWREINMVFSKLQAWHPSIVWEKSGHGRRVSFLDLDISIDAGRCVFQTHRKEQNAYLYLPRTSCHPASVLKALVIGETQRLFKTCLRNPMAFAKHLGFFLDKLRNRGYNRHEAEILANSTVQKLKNRLRSGSKRDRKFFFKLEYSSSLNIRAVNVALKRHWHVVCSVFRSPVRVMLSHSVQKNTFRRDFATNWVCNPTRSG